MARIRSKLAETDFSRFNLRDAYITDYPNYAAALRDESLFSNYGIKAIIKIPKIENNVDEYSNFVDDDFEITTESVIPKFEQYRQNVSVEGMSADGTEGLYPLEVLIPTKLHLPKNSRIVLTEYNSKEAIVAREWTVLSTEMKQLSGSKTYTRVAYCTPSRQTIQRTMEFEETYGTFYFNIHPITIEITKDIHASCTFYFDTNSVSLNKVFNIEIDESAGYSNNTQEHEEVLTNGTDPSWEETCLHNTNEVVKALKTKDQIMASFIIKPTTLSVLY